LSRRRIRFSLFVSIAEMGDLSRDIWQNLRR
jgi:hypothetical protein